MLLWGGDRAAEALRPGCIGAPGRCTSPRAAGGGGATAAAPEPVEGPAGWRGSDLTYDGRGWVTELSPADLAELDRALEATAGRDLASLTAADFDPYFQGLGPKLREIKRGLVGGRGIALLRGLPVDSMSLEDAARAFWGLALKLGGVDPVPQNRAGHLLGHVRDIGGDPGRDRIYTTSAAQPFHTDSADIVGLLCLQQAASGGESTVVSSTTVWNQMCRFQPRSAAALRDNLVVWDRKGEVPAGKDPYFAVPTFCSVEEGRMCSILDRSFVVAAQEKYSEAEGVPRLSPELEEALDAAEALADAYRLEMLLAPGDIQLLHNHQCWHARAAYSDAKGRSPRHLLRLWLSARDGWELPAEYAERYGPVARGGIRGGIRCPGVAPYAPLDPAG